MRTKNIFPVCKASVYILAAATVCVIWLCSPQQARAQWSTSGNTTSTTNNVGVGTSSPTGKLEVQEPSGTNGVNMFTLASRGNSNTDLGQMLFRHSDAASNIFNTAVIRWETTTGTDGKLSFWTATNSTNAMIQRMTIDGSGNIGIGT